MQAKDSSTKTDQDRIWRPISEQLYPEFVQDEQFKYFRFWCTPKKIVYEKYKGEVRVSFFILPDGLDIFSFNSTVDYVEANQRAGADLCKSVLRE